MFNAIAINASALRRQILHAMAAESGMLMLAKATDGYPLEEEIERLAPRQGLDVLFLDLEDPGQAYRCLSALKATVPQVPVVGIGGKSSQQKNLGMLGVGHFLPFPPDTTSFSQTLAAAIRSHDDSPLADLFAFMPAKAGCGASTIALSASVALAEGLRSHVLCMEADLASGVLSMLVDQEPHGTTQGALASAYELDKFRWTECVTQHLGVDFLLSATDPQPLLVDWSHYFALVRFVAHKYEATVVDLPQLINDASVELVRRAARVFIVTSQEPPSVQLARRRVRELASWGVPEERVELLVNRWHRNEMPADNIAEYVGRPVAQVFANEYLTVRPAKLGRNLPLSPKTPFGHAVAEFAHRLAGVPMEIEAPQGSSRLTGLLRGLVSRA